MSQNDATAAERAQWLSELASTIEEAQSLAWQLGISEGDDPEAKLLCARLEAARNEVEALRRRSWVGTRQELDPIWKKLLPWQAGIQEPDELGSNEA